MLSRTADNLYWMARLVERAESLSRILDTTLRLTATPVNAEDTTNEWESAIATAGCEDAFYNEHEDATEQTVINYLAFSRSNPSSIRNCIENARHNGRAVRTALTTEMWDTINGAWNELQSVDEKRMSRNDITPFLRWTQEFSLRFDGNSYRTMLRNDAYLFSRIGVNIERADNTSRLLDVKYHLLLPEHEPVGGPLDYLQWSAILRSVSALTAYHWVYRDNIRPWRIADLLILNDQLPRSLASCYDNLGRYLDDLGRAYAQQGPAQRHSRSMRARLTNLNIEQIFQGGLHEFITDFLGNNNQMGFAITKQYLS
ncbi:hypothetical protein GJW-30_1_02664 [Variibacter gotjawalensis]|uniref:DUF403 domain-containing protein n=1 Tax=Variibacter gotjawalensis TaxID=1333996 RepID=A0A0S3PW21_9BRAD|nr:alpha-E domain-containing protein [Variibacter gotjawalensis]NIK45955.1 putative alpha-E superfamily protein [Variibacter gotjawalensis]RZS47873.1 putative alpha-E superfamily protein [Variibacter gotjawalensis]BAT60129.1 hypothetical protein GJW-30_1_02664 [Variibacter gotjawalensis]